jgi:hypothetical protein
MKLNIDKLRHGPYAEAETRYKRLFNSDPLREHDLPDRLGDFDITVRPAFDPSKLSMADYRESARIRESMRPVEDLLVALGHRLDRMESAAGATSRRILREARAVRNARVAAGVAGTTGLGGAGYGTYRALAGKRKER